MVELSFNNISYVIAMLTFSQREARRAQNEMLKLFLLHWLLNYGKRTKVR
jgi:hypothetical protein